MDFKEKQQLGELDAKIKEVRANLLDDDGGKKGQGSRFGAGWGLGARLATELLGGVVVGAGIGLLLDDWLETKPVFLVVFLLFGTAAGILNVYRTAEADSKKAEPKQGKKEQI